jgi:hypothetical protein
MKVEKTPEEAAKSKRAHADSMIVMGAVTTIAALCAAWIAMSGRGDVPDWMFGGKRAERAAAGDWTNSPTAVHFEEWGRAPFIRAKSEGKLVLLFLGPSFSATTARMEAETFGDLPTAAFTDARFIPVRVRSEDYPDLDRRYRAGGWPTTAALLPDGVPLAAGNSMTPAVFRRWAAALADKSAAHPEILTRVDAEAADRRRAEEAAGAAAKDPMDAAEAERRAQSALFSQWDAARRTFDRLGPRFPRFERIAALRALKAPWAKDMASEAAKGSLLFEDPKDGGFRRALNPDGSPAALEIVANDQAASLDALCGAMPASARKELAFLIKAFVPKPPPFAWRGWQAGYALTEDRHRASDGPDFDKLSWEGWRPVGRARLADDGELSRAVLSCAEASASQKSYAKKVLARAWNEFGHAAVAHDKRLLLDDALGLGGALLAAGRPADALSVWRWMDANLADGPAYYDRATTSVLPAEMDRVAYAGLNARALTFMRRLLRDQPGAARQCGLPRRDKQLYAWLSARSESLDPAVWAALAAQEPR